MEPIVKCRDCRGEGIKPGPRACTRCNGEGKIAIGASPALTALANAIDIVRSRSRSSGEEITVLELVEEAIDHLEAAASDDPAERDPGRVGLAYAALRHARNRLASEQAVQELLAAEVDRLTSAPTERPPAIAEAE